ncbi:PaaI family thioesterase [Myxococcus stipitatus]|uniref:PaaI family thioesterase n=1 Tax=Myxococcus stipitatus TaxID=83455 RepID=UPI001F3BDB6E|nr:PaaI family thioesterase [Myxococcus stipitatus]MCE9670316.1 PaaI family thioesterase [Myxococcus stipitatus]
MESFLEIGNEILSKQPFSQLLGTQLTRLTPSEAVLELSLRDDMKQQYGFVHGGVLSYMADNALTFAGGFAMRGVQVVTAEFKINYVRPAIGTRLVARARTVHVGRRQTVCQCDLFVQEAERETLVAVAQGTISAMGSREE